MLFCVVWSSKLLQTIFSCSNVSANYISSLIYIGAILGSPLIGFISDRTSSRKKIIIFCSVTCIFILLLITFSAKLNIPVLILLYFILGINTGAICLGFSYLTESNGTKYAGFVTAMGTSLAIAVSALLQPVYGFLVDTVSSVSNLTTAFILANLIIPACLLLGVVLIIFTKDTKRIRSNK
jgi:MFS family permease